MRFVIVFCVLLCGCDEDLFYADGSAWAPVEDRDVPQLLKNDALVKHPHLRRMPTTEQEWTRFIQTLNAQPVRNIGDKVQTFTPTSWTGFSSDPSGDISYLDLGIVVIMYRATSLVNTSDDVQMILSGVPESIRPEAARLVQCMVTNAGGEFHGSAQVGSDGNIIFGIGTVTTVGATGDHLVLDAGGFLNSGNKGLPSGWLIIYPK